MIEDVKCPECNGPMVSRKNKTSGEIFWGCKAFPQCRGTRNNLGESKYDRENNGEMREYPSSYDKASFRKGR